MSLLQNILMQIWYLLILKARNKSSTVNALGLIETLAKNFVKYKKLGELSKTEEQSINKLSEMLEEYSIAIKSIGKLKAANKDIPEIKKQVQINDRPYLNALLLLDQVFEQSLQNRQDIDAKIKIDDSKYLTAIKDLKAIFEETVNEKKSIDNKIKINDTPYLKAFQTLDQVFKDASNAKKDIDTQIKISDTPYFEALNKLHVELEKATAQKTERLTSKVSTAKTLILVIAIIFIFSISIVASKLILKLSKQINKVIDSVNNIGNGNLDSKLIVNSQDELGQLASSVNQMRENVKQQQENFKDSYAALEEKHKLKEAITDLYTNLRGDLDLHSFSDTLLNHLTPKLNAQLSALYINKDDELKLVSSYANSKNIKESFSFGEGLVGQAAKSKKILEVNNPPDTFPKITSSLGETAPNAILIVPVIYQSNVTAVLEFASASKLSEEGITTLKEGLENIAISINNAVKNKVNV